MSPSNDPPPPPGASTSETHHCSVWVFMVTLTEAETFQGSLRCSGRGHKPTAHQVLQPAGEHESHAHPHKGVQEMASGLVHPASTHGVGANSFPGARGAEQTHSTSSRGCPASTCTFFPCVCTFQALWLPDRGGGCTTLQMCYTPPNCTFLND